MKSSPRKRPRRKTPPMATLTGIPRVLLLIETSDGYGRRILEGIGRYVRERGPWSLYFETRQPGGPPQPLGRPLAGRRHPGPHHVGEYGRSLRATGVPMVELLGERPEEPAKVHGDNVSAGRLAAEHLLGCGLRHFGFFAFGEAWWIAAYREGFQETLELHRFACDAYRPPRRNFRLWPKWRDSMQPHIMAWLQSLPKPAGVFAPSIEYAGLLLGLCRNLGIAVPEEIAVLGSVDDPAICNVFTPPLELRGPAGRTHRLRGGSHAGSLDGGRKAAETHAMASCHPRRGAAIDRPGGDRRCGRGPRRAVHPRARLPGNPRAGGGDAHRALAADAGTEVPTIPGPHAQGGDFEDPSSNGRNCC